MPGHKVTRTIKHTDAQPRSIEAFVERLVQLIERKKGQNTVVLDVGDAPLVIDKLVVSEAHSGKQLRAIAEYLKETIDAKPYAVEGLDSQTWAVLDFGTVVVHIFEREAREFYDLDGLWDLSSDA
jgi:ribosome-associated protein